MSFTEKTSNGAFNNTTPVDVVAAPGASTRRVVRNITVKNKDTASVTVTLRYNDNGTIRELPTVVLLTGESVVYDDVLVLDAATKKIDGLLGGAVASAQPTFVCTFADIA